MRWYYLPVTAATAVIVVSNALWYLLVPGIHAQRSPAPKPVSECSGSIIQSLSSEVIQVCEPLTATVKVTSECPGCPGGINVVFIQIEKTQNSDWMNGESIAMLDVLIELKKQHKVRVGIVHYGANHRAALEMTDEVEQARGPLNQPSDGWLPIADVIGAARKALEMLRAQRGGPPSGAGEPCEIIVFFAVTKPEYVDQGAKMLDAARMITSDNVEVFVGCPTTSPILCSFTKQMTNPSNYTGFNEHGKLARMADRKIDDFIGGLTIRDLYITQFVPPGLTYIAGSANVPPKRVARTLDARTRLDWEWKQIRSTAPQTITYQAKPLAEGTWEITGTMKLVDTRSLAREVVMASQPVTVSGLCLPPSPTPSPTDPPTPTAIPTHTPLPTPTSTATPTATPTPVPTATPTATPTPEPGPLYLPLLLHERCTPDQRRVDVALVIDASSSMTEPTAIGRTKLDAARQAAGAFLDQLRFDRGDQAAIVAFNAASTLLQPLGGDRAALGGALDRVQVAQQTCIVCGLETALAELSSPRRVAGHTPTVILLTDGRSNPRPVGEAVARAAEGKARGVVVFTIGLGRDVEEAELAAMASGPGYYHHAPDAEALAGIYRRIAVDLPCPAGEFWGGR